MTIATEDGRKVNPSRRYGSVLLIDFWSVLYRPSPEHVTALREIHEAFKDSGVVEFIGVNADSESRLEAARNFAADNGYIWPQHYERRSTRAPITHAAFGAGNPPWQIVIDRYGYVRAVGAATDPAFQYALRAAVAEARDRYAYIPPVTVTGGKAESEWQPPAADRQASVRDPQAQPPPDPPSNADALAKLRRARLYLKTGKRTDAKRLFEEIVREYPGTREARRAQEYLDYW